MTSTFTAVAWCPKCGDIGVHWLDEPMGSPTPEEWRNYNRQLDVYLASPMTEIQNFQGETIRQHHSSPKPLLPHDESTFEVIRICKECGHRWGM